MSERDKNLLIIFFVVIVLAIPYFVFYRPYAEKVSQTQFNIEKIKQEIEAIRIKKEQLKDSDKEKSIIEFNINETLSELPPEIFLERILLDIEEIQQESNIEFSTESFSDVDVVSDYLENINVDDDKAPIEMFIDLNFSGTYNSLKNFLYIISNNNQNMRINDISLNPGINTNMSGTISLTYFAYKDSSLLDMVSEYEIKTNTGKDNIFIPFEDYDEELVFEEDETELIIDFEKYDFNIRLSPSTNIRPSILVEKTEVPLTRVLDDGNKEIEVEIDLFQEDGKFYFRYKTEFSSYPESYEYKEFIPNDDEKILIKIISDDMDNENDEASAKIVVLNKTGIRCVINNYVGDIERADIVIEEGEVYVYKKEIQQ